MIGARSELNGCCETVIKLTGENHKDIDDVAAQIKTICDSEASTSVDQSLSQPADSSCLFASTRRREAKPTTTGKCASTSGSSEMDISTAKDQTALRSVSRFPSRHRQH